MCLLYKSIRDKLELKDRGTYNEAVKIAREQWRKKVRKQEMVSKGREIHFHHGGVHLPFGELVKPMNLDVHHDREPHVEAPKVIDPSKS